MKTPLHIAFGVLMAFMLFSGFLNVLFYLKIQNLNFALAKERTLLNVQNAQIEKLKLESEKYACDIESLNAYTRGKYESVISENEAQTCEEKLGEFERALGIYEKRDKPPQK